MTARWHALHVFTSSLDALLVELVGPFLEQRVAMPGEKAFWERHYAGGPHLRIRVYETVDRVPSTCDQLKRLIEPWLAAHPSPRANRYSAQRARDLLSAEGVDPASEAVDYRRDLIADGVYPEPGKVFASDGARSIAEEFRCLRGPLAVQILQHDTGRHWILYECFLALALYIGNGRYVPGSVSYKSHWEGFFATCPSAALLDRILATYRQRRSQLSCIAMKIERAWHSDRLAGEPLLSAWLRVLAQVSESIREVLGRGEPLASAASEAEMLSARQQLFTTQMRRSSAFVETLWSDPRFMLAIRDDSRFQYPRALINLLYELVAAVGLSAIDKMVLCHSAFSIVEEICRCDLNDQLRTNMATILATGKGERVWKP